jgi:hypothetical protein
MARTKGRASIVSISLHLRARDGQHAEVPVDPKRHDAVFFTLSAVDKFLVPFYAARDGLDAALKLRAEVARAFRRTGGIGVVLHHGMCRLIVSPIRWRRVSMAR